MNYYAGRELSELSEYDKLDHVSITLAAPETIRTWSRGEVKNPETINYRTYKPERGGLFCERIFGPTKDWECSCGKYKRIKHKGVICDRCGVEVTVSRVRRERLAHIELAVPVSHIWFFKCTPSRIGLMLDMTASSLERVLYYEDYIVVDPGDTPLKEKQLLTDTEFREAEDKYGDSFDARMGADAVRDVLRQLDMDSLIDQLEEDIENTRSKQTRKKLSKRMKAVEGFRRSNTRPEWMILEVLPVIPPDLRPLVPLEGGRFATSDLNDLYRRVINRNNRLKNLLLLKTPDVIIRNEKRMLQEAVDAVFDNGRHGRAVTGAGNRPLKSLSDMLRGKGGRFRQNLLGKRVDYSGRSVIVVGPELKLHQCGLPKKMALVLFEPFIIKRLKDLGIAHTVRSAKKLIEKQSPEVWDIIEDVTRGKTVMLNRAPTLHRLSMQAFEPVLVEGDALRIHPLVCTAFNADFDGDQMAVHVPLSIEAQIETKLLMMSTNSIFSPSSGNSIMTPTQDIALGIYYMTALAHKDKLNQFSKKKKTKGEHLSIIASTDEVRLAYDDRSLLLHDKILFANPDFGKDTVFGDKESKLIETTIGRVIFNELWPDGMGFVNKVVDKGVLGNLIWQCHKISGKDVTVEILDRLKSLGFEHATLAGVSIGMVDMIIPSDKPKIIGAAMDTVAEVDNQYRQGIITDGERYNKIIDIWTDATETISNSMYRSIEENDIDSNEINPVYMMVDSKARGSRQQIRQLAGMRGLMAKPSGEIIERPIVSNFREGLSVLEYFISTHGARKGLADTALKTADAGYLTRKLVDVSQDVIIVEQDCKTVNGVDLAVMDDGDEDLTTLRTHTLGRTVLDDVLCPDGTVIVKAGDEVNEEACDLILSKNVTQIRMRSVLTCEARTGLCAKCYGRDLATGGPVEIGTAVGIIAAQSIGEPGTQLTMRTFHIGGTASTSFKQPEINTKNAGSVRYHDIRVVRNQEGDHVVLNKNGAIGVYSDSGVELEHYTVNLGSILLVDEGDTVKAETLIAKWDPYSVPVLAEQEGNIEFHDFVNNVTMKTEVDEVTGLEGTVVLESKEDLHPQIVIKDDSGKEILGFYSIPSGAHVIVKEGGRVKPGDQLAKIPRKDSKTKDITGGLPRVAELFEARQPRDAAEIAKIEGIVDFAPNQRGRRCLVIRDEITGGTEEHLIPMGKHIVVFKGDRVRKGQQLTDGPIVPQEILEVCGPQELQEYLVSEVQQVYRLQGVEINDKHIEIIVRQMLRKVRVTDPGDTDFLWGEQVMKQAFLEENEAAIREGKRPAEATPALLGITKASLETESFISAASFQDTTRVLTDAATLGKKDTLRGFKENVIMGHLIPGGTGFHMYRDIKLVPLAEPLEEEDSKEKAEGEKKLQDLLG